MDDATRNLIRAASETQPLIHNLPSREAMATDQVRAEIVALGELTAALLTNAQEQRTAIDNAAESADRSARAVVWLTRALVVLTLALVVLTYLILAEVLGLPPFPPIIPEPVELVPLP